MTTTFDRMVRAMQASPAWPAVFDAGSARVLLIAALREAREPDNSALEASWRNTREVKPDERMACLLAEPRMAHKVKMLRRWRAMIDQILSEAEG